jgi:DNA-binding CsgD family transcriptional regulator
VPALTRSDAEGLLRFVGEAESLGGDEPFTGELLVELGRLVQADWVTYNELDRVRRRNLLYVIRTGDDDDLEGDNPDPGAIFWEYVIEEHPVCLRHQQGHPGALKLSDFFSLRELHRTRLYDLWFRPLGIDYELNVPIPSPLWHTKTFLFERTGGRRDFTGRDRLVLDQLQPHLARLWQAARTQRLLSASLAALERASTNDSRGVVLFGRAGQIEFASEPARQLLGEFFPNWRGARLPTAFEEWLASGAKQPLVRRRGRRQLSIERSADALLLELTSQEALLTAREREVLAWVARGKTNAEIAQLLWLAPSTVRKHLENVYAKLDVNTRTAAVARFLGLLDAEAEAS